MAKSVDELKKICPEINTDLGIQYSGDDPDFYIEMLSEYISSDKLKMAEESYEARDEKLYCVCVHSIKSMSLSIGAEGLSADAKALEMAANGGDWDYIKANHKLVMDKYRSLIDILGAFLQG